jgi:hypothetical protein
MRRGSSTDSGFGKCGMGVLLSIVLHLHVALQLEDCCSTSCHLCCVAGHLRGGPSAERPCGSPQLPLAPVHLDQSNHRGSRGQPRRLCPGAYWQAWPRCTLAGFAPVSTGSLRHGAHQVRNSRLTARASGLAGTGVVGALAAPKAARTPAPIGRN